MSRPNGLTITLTNLGNGEVVRDTARDALYPEATPRMDSPKTPNAPNLRMLNALAGGRPGYRTFGNVPAATPVNGLYQVLYSDGTNDLVRCDEDKVRRYSGGSWADITGAATLTGNYDDVWTFAEVRRIGASKSNQLFLCNGVNEVYKSVGGGTNIATVGAATITGVRAIVGHKGRALFGNVIDSGSVRRQQRVQYSIVSDPETLTGVGSGFVELDEDSYPIAAMSVVGGNVCAYKGGTGVGGSIVVGTPTGITNTPYRWDTLTGHKAGVGILCPRTLVIPSPSLAFYLGHDGFYLHDGARGLLAVAPNITENILSRLNYAALRMGVAWYKPRTGEIHVALPMGSATTPNEVWVFNLRQRRVYGPYFYALSITAAATYASTGALTWDTFPAGLTWDTLPYATWDTIGGTPSAQAIILGSSTGVTVEDDDSTFIDDAIDVTGSYETGVITSDGYTINGRVLTRDDMLTLHDVAVIYKDAGPWTPSVEVSINGGQTWTTISDGAQVGTGDTRYKQALYTTELSSTWFQLRISGSGMLLSGLRLEFTHAGSSRND